MKREPSMHLLTVVLLATAILPTGCSDDKG